jgi:hypothetical protein
VAAAEATHGLPSDAAAPVQLKLLDDPDIGVRRTVLEAVKTDAVQAVAASIRQWASQEPDKAVKDLAITVLQKMKS